ncbi:hypothetical protein Efla_006017 [Eimeria flavescens]
MLTETRTVRELNGIKGKQRQVLDDWAEDSDRKRKLEETLARLERRQMDYNQLRAQLTRFEDLENLQGAGDDVAGDRTRDLGSGITGDRCSARGLTRGLKWHLEFEH